MRLPLARRSIDHAFGKCFAGSERLFGRSQSAIAGGFTHDGRRLDPFPIYITRAQGARKWDVDGNELLDYWMGHGALLLGHNHPYLIRAIQKQLALGTNYGAAHELEVRWAEFICELVPGAETVRFTSSGTEATMLAFRQARAFTGRDLVIRFAGHFHGWHDYAMVGYEFPFEGPSSAGVPRAAQNAVLVAYPDDLDSVESLLRKYPGEVAAIILEPGGGSNALIPTDRGFLHDLRELCDREGLVLVFDEVITGFRYAPGGAQEVFGVTADLVTLAKAVAGGLPGGAIVGRRDILDVHDRPPPKGEKPVLHFGTFNANPVSAAAGIASLELISEGWPTTKASAIGEDLRGALREVLNRHALAGAIAGAHSVFQVLLGDDVCRAVETRDVAVLLSARARSSALLRRAMLLNGVDLMHSGGFVSIDHGQQEVQLTVKAFDAALNQLREEGLV